MILPVCAVAAEMMSAPRALRAAFAVDLKIFAHARCRLGHAGALGAFEFQCLAAETRPPDRQSLQTRGFDIDALASGIENDAVDVACRADRDKAAPDVVEHQRRV